MKILQFSTAFICIYAYLDFIYDSSPIKYCKLVIAILSTPPLINVIINVYQFGPLGIKSFFINMLDEFTGGNLINYLYERRRRLVYRKHYEPNFDIPKDILNYMADKLVFCDKGFINIYQNILLYRRIINKPNFYKESWDLEGYQEAISNLNWSFKHERNKNGIYGKLTEYREDKKWKRCLLFLNEDYNIKGFYKVTGLKKKQLFGTSYCHIIEDSIQENNYSRVYQAVENSELHININGDLHNAEDCIYNNKRCWCVELKTEFVKYYQKGKIILGYDNEEEII